MRQKQIIVMCLVWLSLTYAVASEKNGFDEICIIYMEAINRNLSLLARSEYIFDNIQRRVHSVDAITAHTSIFQLDSAERYAIFKESAEYSLKRSWSCSPMEKLLQ